jgi:hypothetical protein
MNPNDVDLDPYDGLPPLSPDEEATMHEEIELALDRLPTGLPQAMIATLRERLEHAARTHSYPRQLIKAFAPRKPTVVSGEGRIDGADEHEEKAGGKEGA